MKAGANVGSGGRGWRFVRLDVTAWLLALLALLGASLAPERGVVEIHPLLVAGPATGDVLPSAGSRVDQRLPQFEERQRLERGAAPIPTDGPWATIAVVAVLPTGGLPASPGPIREADLRPIAAAAYEARAPPYTA